MSKLLKLLEERSRKPADYEQKKAKQLDQTKPPTFEDLVKRSLKPPAEDGKDEIKIPIAPELKKKLLSWCRANNCTVDEAVANFLRERLEAKQAGADGSPQSPE